MRRPSRLGMLTPPKETSTGEVDTREQARFLRRAMDALKEDDEDRRASSSFDFRDEVEVESAGIGAEVVIPHDLGFRPARMLTVDPGDFDGGRVTRSRPDLGDEKAIYVKTNAPAGTRFVIVVAPKRRR